MLEYFAVHLEISARVYQRLRKGDALMIERIRFYTQVVIRGGGFSLPGRGASMGC